MTRQTFTVPDGTDPVLDAEGRATGEVTTIPNHEADVGGEPYNGFAPCPHCFESSGYAARIVSATYWEPSWVEPDPLRQCPYCGGTGEVECEPITLDDLEELAAEEG